jgi:hypothetical protein
MVNITSTLLTANEWQSLYEPPALSDSERVEYFTFSEAELDTLYRFNPIGWLNGIGNRRLRFVE